jgi:WD40-like Beta Propeller Repeat
MEQMSQPRLSWFLRIGVTVAALCAIVPSGAFGSFPGRDGVIAYTAVGDGIWALEPATGDQLQLTTGREDGAPAFSPSGNMIAFQRGRGNSAIVFIALANGDDARPLVHGREPAFSPDGREIVFVRSTGLFITGLSADAPVRRIVSQPGDARPQWSSTGAILFQRNDKRWLGRRHGGKRLWLTVQIDVIPHGGASPRSVISYEEEDLINSKEQQQAAERPAQLYPDWSPNSKTIEVALCAPSPVSRHPPWTSTPAILQRLACSSQVWAPTGQRLTSAEEGGEGVYGRGPLRLAWRPETICPGVNGLSEISWQPLVRETLQVPTVQCPPYTSAAAWGSTSDGNSPESRIY